MKRLMLLLSFSLMLVGCSNGYVKSTVVGTIIEANTNTRTMMIPVSSGKVTNYVPNISYSCNYKIDIDKTTAFIQTGNSCRYDVNDSVKVQLIHDKDTDVFIKYSIIE